MTINVEYFDNVIKLEDDFVVSIEIENKNVFYRFIKDFYEISYGNVLEEVKFFNQDMKELNSSVKVQVFSNYFEIDFDSKKISNALLKYVYENISDIDRQSIIKSQQKLIDIYNKILNELDLPLNVNSDISVEAISKYLKISINKPLTLLDNLFLLIDLERELKINELLIFVNLKSYLSKDELIELYKYSIYNKVKILLVDAFNYGVTLNNEKKLIIDENLDEIML